MTLSTHSTEQAPRLETGIPEPKILRQFQDFSDLPAVQVRKGIDDDGNPWTPDLFLAEGPADTGAAVADWARKRFAGKDFDRDFSGERGIPDKIGQASDHCFWIIRAENQQVARKLLTVRLFAAPAGYEDEALAWTPIDKFLWEIEGRQQTAIARKLNLQALFEAWAGRSFFRDLLLPPTPVAAAVDPAWLFVGVLLTDAALDHPENVCHCGSEQVCEAGAEGLDRRDARYPFERMFRHSIRTTFPLLKPSGMRIFLLG